MGVTAHTPLQNRTCSTKAYGSSHHILIIYRINLLLFLVLITLYLPFFPSHSYSCEKALATSLLYAPDSLLASLRLLLLLFVYNSLDCFTIFVQWSGPIAKEILYAPSLLKISCSETKGIFCLLLIY
jgi:hypothetical protein